MQNNIQITLLENFFKLLFENSLNRVLWVLDIIGLIIALFPTITVQPWLIIGLNIIVLAMTSVFILIKGKYREISKPEIILLEHTYHINALAISRDEKYLASCGGDDYAILWDIHNMKLSCRFQHDSWVANVAFSPDSKCLYTLTGKNGTLSQWDIKKKNLTYSRSVHLDQTRGLDISKSGKRVAISCKDGTFSYFDPTDEKSIIWPIKISDVELRKIRIGVTEIIATGNSKGEIFLIDFRKPKKGQIKRIHLDISEEMIRGLSFNSKGTFLAFTNSGGFVKILNLRTNCYFSVKAHNGHAIAVGFSPNDQFIVTGGQDNIICVWKFKKGKLRKSLEFHGHTDSVTALVFDKNKRLYSSSRDGTIRVWNLSGLY